MEISKMEMDVTKARAAHRRDECQSDAHSAEVSKRQN